MGGVSGFAEVYCGEPGVVLVLFFFTCFLAQGNSEMFSINPSVYEEEYRLSDTDIRLFLDYEAFSFILFAWPFMELFRRNQDLRTWVVRFISAVAFGSTLRMIPLWADVRMVWLFHISQMIIPLGNFATALPAQIAVVWFPVEHRGFATAILTIAGVLGPTIFRSIGAEITTNTSQAQKMFYFEDLLAVTVFLLIVAYLPKQPTDHSEVEALRLITGDQNQSSPAAKGWLQAMLARNKVEINWGKGVVPMIVATALPLALKAAVFSNMTSLLEDDDIDNLEAAWISSIQGYTQIIGACVLGYIMSFKRVRAERRWLLIGCFFIYGMLTVLFSFSFSSVFWDSNPLPYHYWLSMTIEGLAGIFWGCTRPLAFEFIAELSYPTPPGYFGAWILFAYNAVKAVALLIPSSTATEFMFVFVAASSFFSCFLIWLGTPSQLGINKYDFNEELGYGSPTYENKKKFGFVNAPLYVIDERNSNSMY